MQRAVEGGTRAQRAATSVRRGRYVNLGIDHGLRVRGGQMPTWYS